MKGIYRIVALGILLILLFSGCEFFMGDDGRDGKAYVEVTLADDYVEYWTASVEGFPDGWFLETPYELDQGLHDITYILLYNEYEYNGTEGTYTYNYYFNSLVDYDYVYYFSEVSFQDAMSDFLYADYAAVCSDSVTIAVEEGEEGELFVDGDDGDDRYYTLSLTWDPDDIVISFNGIALDKTFTTDGDSKVLTFTDGYTTFTVTVPEAPAASSGNINSIQGEVR